MLRYAGLAVGTCVVAVLSLAVGQRRVCACVNQALKLGWGLWLYLDLVMEQGVANMLGQLGFAMGQRYGVLLG